MNETTEKTYQLDLMGDLGRAIYKVSNKEYESALAIISDVADNILLLSDECEYGRK